MNSRIIGLLAAVCALASIAHAQPRDPKKHQLLWRLTKEGVPHVSYLFGTIHVDREAAFRFGDSVLPAISACQAIALEVDVESPEMENYIQASLGRYVEKRLSQPPATRTDMYRQLSGRLAKSNEPTAYETFVDFYLYRYAVAQGKMSLGLENIDSLQYYLSIERQEADAQKVTASSMRENAAALLSYINESLAWYQHGNLDELEAMVNKWRPFNTPLMDRRNSWMADSLDLHARQQSVFAAVGAAHLAGGSSVIAKLRARGWTVQPVLQTFNNVAPRKLPRIRKIARMSLAMSGDSLVSMMMPGHVSVVPVQTKSGKSGTIMLSRDFATDAYVLVLAKKYEGKPELTSKELRDKMLGARPDLNAFEETIGKYSVHMLSNRDASGGVAFVKTDNHELMMIFVKGNAFDSVRAIVGSLREK